MPDVIVAGGGPAGNIAAWRLSELGYQVSVLDWREHLGDKLCTGIVGRECVERFPPDEADVYWEAQSARVIAPSGKGHMVATDQAQAYVIDRVAYVASMARKASSAGASYMLGENVVGIEHSDSQVTVHTTSDSGPRRYEARVLIIATGFASPLLQMMGLTNGTSADYMLASQAEVVADHLTEVEVYLGNTVAPGSFGWLVPLSSSRALAGLVSRQRLNGRMPRFLSALEQMGKVRSVVSEPKRWGIPIKPLRKTFGDRVVVAGDAAGLAKPTTGGGIYYALVSGEIAANAVHRSFAAGDCSARQMSSYEREWKAVFGRELQIGYYARRLYEALRDDQIERLVNEFVSAHTRHGFMSSVEFSFDWHSGPILKAIGHSGLGKVIRSFRPAVTPFLSRLSRSPYG